MANSSCLVLGCLVLLVAAAGATQFKVGDQMGWTVPGPAGVPYKQWAESNRFQIGDSLLFVYPPGKDSVLLVDKEAYETCNTTTYLDKFQDGNTAFSFNRSGPFYFISGVEANCLKNESVAIVVLADRSSRRGGGAAGANPPTKPPTNSPSPASSSSPPPPPPETSGSSSPPPAGSSDATPSAAPPAEGSSAPPRPPPSQSGASARVVGFVGSFGSLFGLLALAL